MCYSRFSNNSRRKRAIWITICYGKKKIAIEKKNNIEHHILLLQNVDQLATVRFSLTLSAVYVGYLTSYLETGIALRSSLSRILIMIKWFCCDVSVERNKVCQGGGSCFRSWSKCNINPTLRGNSTHFIFLVCFIYRVMCFSFLWMTLSGLW